MLEKITTSCAFVISHAKHVKINYQEIDKLISTIDTKDLKYWLNNNPYNLFSLDIETIINFMLILESIDYSFFGNPKWTITTPEGPKDGTDALLYTLLNYVKENHNTDFSKLSFADFQSLLKGSTEIPLLKERYDTVYEISTIVNKKMNGSFYKAIKDIKTDTELFELIISTFPSFKDERTYEGKTIYHYKLAQLLVSDIVHLRASIENFTITCHNLVGCPDYKIPQTMRALNILEYDDELSNLIDTKTEIAINSPYEVEIRSSMIVVINYIKNKLPEIDSIDINDYFFLLSKKVKNVVKPYHLCRNTNY